MPALKIMTNISRNAIPKDFMQKIIPVLSKTVKKPEDKFLVAISTDCLLSVNGKDEPSIIASIESIGNLGPPENQVISREVTALLSKELGVDKDQVFITFYDLEPYNVAKNGATVEGLN